MVTPAWLLHVFILELGPAEFLDQNGGLEDRATVLAAAAEVVDLARPGRLGEPMKGAADVPAVDVVTDLLGLVPVDPISGAGQRRLDEIREEAMQFHAAVLGPGQASAPEDSHLQTEVAAVLLHHHVGG